MKAHEKVIQEKNMIESAILQEILRNPKFEYVTYLAFSLASATVFLKEQGMTHEFEAFNAELSMTMRMDMEAKQ